MDETDLDYSLMCNQLTEADIDQISLRVFGNIEEMLDSELAANYKVTTKEGSDRLALVDIANDILDNFRMKLHVPEEYWKPQKGLGQALNQIAFYTKVMVFQDRPCPECGNDMDKYHDLRFGKEKGNSAIAYIVCKKRTENDPEAKNYMQHKEIQIVQELLTK